MLSPGSSEREEYLKQRARVEMQNMLSHIEEASYEDAPAGKPVMQARHTFTQPVVDDTEVILDEEGELLSPGSPEREEYLKKRARVEMQNMLSHIEKKQSAASGSRGSHKLLSASVSQDDSSSGGSSTIHSVGKQPAALVESDLPQFVSVDDNIATRRRLMNRSLPPLARVPSSSEDAGLPVPPSLSGSGDSSAAKVRDVVKTPGSQTKDAVSAILAQLQSMKDDDVDLSDWTGDLRELGGTATAEPAPGTAEAAAVDAAPPVHRSSAAESSEILQRQRCVDIESDEQESSEEMLEEEQLEKFLPPPPPLPPALDANFLGVISDGEICWRILQAVPWQQLRRMQRVSRDFRVASQVVLALRPQAICVGGGNRGRALRSAVAYDAECDQWSLLAPMAVERNNSAVCGLTAGAGLLVAGGYNGKGIEASAERFDVAQGRWLSTAPMPIGKSGCRGVLLTNANLALVVGGYDEDHETLARVDTYDWATDEWNRVRVPPMCTARYDCAACALPGDRAVVAGGTDAGQSWLVSAEVYDHSMGVWSALPSLGVQRDRCSAVGLSLGSAGVATVLVLGGSSHPTAEQTFEAHAAEKRSSSPPAPGIVDLNTCEALTVGADSTSAGSWVAAPKLVGARCSFGAVAVGGVILAMGGEASGAVERLRPGGGGWQAAAGLPHPRVGASAGVCAMAPPPGPGGLWAPIVPFH